MASKVIVVANSNNLSGYLNNFMGSKLRIDYGQLLDFAKDNREILGAFIVSQNDTSHPAVSKDKKKQANKFLFTLRAFGWTPVKADYDSSKEDALKAVSDKVYEAVCSILLDENNVPKMDLNDVDIVFITGTSSWDVIIKPFADVLNVDILYPEASTSALLKRSYNFYDLTPFVLESDRQVNERKLSVLQSDFH